MALSVAKSRPFRVFGLYRSSGKHAAPRGTVPRAAARPGRRAAHAGPAPERTGPQDGQEKAA